MQNFSDFYNSECCRIQKAKPHMFTLNYKENWNGKLFTDHFNELTLHSHEYIKDAIGEVKLFNQHMGIVRIETLRVLPFSRISDIVSYSNIGKSLQFQAELLNRNHNNGVPLPPDTLITHMVCAYVQRNIEVQSKLITEWWTSKQIKSVA